MDCCLVRSWRPDSDRRSDLLQLLDQHDKVAASGGGLDSPRLRRRSTDQRPACGVNPLQFDLASQNARPREPIDGDRGGTHDGVLFNEPVCLALRVDQEAFHEGRIGAVIDKPRDFDGDGFQRAPISVAWVNGLKGGFERPQLADCRLPRRGPSDGEHTCRLRVSEERAPRVVAPSHRLEAHRCQGPIPGTPRPPLASA